MQSGRHLRRPALIVRKALRRSSASLTDVGRPGDYSPTRDCNTAVITYDAAGVEGGDDMATDKKMVGDDDVYAVTRKGESELKGAKTRVPTSALELLVRIDGRSSVAAIRAGIAGASSKD